MRSAGKWEVKSFGFLSSDTERHTEQKKFKPPICDSVKNQLSTDNVGNKKLIKSREELEREWFTKICLIFLKILWKKESKSKIN